MNKGCAFFFVFFSLFSVRRILLSIPSVLFLLSASLLVLRPNLHTLYAPYCYAWILSVDVGMQDWRKVAEQWKTL